MVLRMRGVLIGIGIFRASEVVLNTTFLFILYSIGASVCLPIAVLFVFVQLSAFTWVKTQCPTFPWGNPRESCTFIWSFWQGFTRSEETCSEKLFGPRDLFFTSRSQSNALSARVFGLNNSYNCRSGVQSQLVELSMTIFKARGVQSPLFGRQLRSLNGTPSSTFYNWADSWCETWVGTGVLTDGFLLVNSCCSDRSTPMRSALITKKWGDLFPTFSGK